jgi:rhodanese-related sulfurtransferase
MLHSQSTLAVYSLLLLLLQSNHVSALQLPAVTSGSSLFTASSTSVQTAAAVVAAVAAAAVPNTSGYAAYCAARQQQLQQPVALDLRTAERYTEQHITGSCSVPLSELVTRLYELPAPFGAPLQLIGSCAERASARIILEQGGWSVGAELDLDAELKTELETELKTEFQPVEGARNRLVLQSGAQSPLIWRYVTSQDIMLQL